MTGLDRHDGVIARAFGAMGPTYTSVAFCVIEMPSYNQQIAKILLSTLSDGFTGTLVLAHEHTSPMQSSTVAVASHHGSMCTELVTWRQHCEIVDTWLCGCLMTEARYAQWSDRESL